MGASSTAVGDYLDATLGSAAPLVFTDELTIYGVAQAHRRVQEALAGGQGLVLDLTEVTELDSAGVQLLLALERECDSLDRPLTVTAVSDAAREVFALLGLTRFTARPTAA